MNGFLKDYLDFLRNQQKIFIESSFEGNPFWEFLKKSLERFPMFSLNESQKCFLNLFFVKFQKEPIQIYLKEFLERKCLEENLEEKIDGGVSEKSLVDFKTELL